MADNLNAFLSDGAIISKISDIIRIIDPLQKKVIECADKDLDSAQLHCFDFWGKNRVCDNCISMRAYNDNKTYVKIEYTNQKTYLITALPHDLEGRTVVIELIKDITNSMIFSLQDSPGAGSGIHALIDNMNKLAFSDPLTGLFNRRYIMEKLPVDLLNAVLLSQDISVIIADIDFFKIVNDTYGHLAGDYTLKKFAETISSCIKRGNDWIARYGGEEFLICMPGADLETAKETSEAMRNAIEKTAIVYDGKEFKITSSFGIYSKKPTESENIDDLLKHADEKLYLAKNNGRNKVEY